LRRLWANVAAVRDDAARDLERRIKSYIGVTASVSVCNPGVIERSAGQAKRVLDRRGEGLPQGSGSVPTTRT
jgi:phenylacetate-CoA ligase